jgi:hypothetical protein
MLLDQLPAEGLLPPRPCNVSEEFSLQQTTSDWQLTVMIRLLDNCHSDTIVWEILHN